MSITSTDRPPKERLNFATYPYDYYTGAQVRVFFGGIWVDDIATIQWQTSHSKAPLYGYNDHQFRAVSKGQFLVNGSFTIAFKETGYLRTIMNLIKDDNTEISRILAGDQKDKKVKRFISYLQKGYTPEEAIDVAARGGEARLFGGATNVSDFEDIVEVMEDTIWGAENAKAMYGKRIPRADEFDYNKYTGKGTDKRYDEDIDVDGFDILVTFGNYDDDNAEHTMISLNDVHITGEALIATPEGDPIGETYNFFARGKNEKVSHAWPEKDRDKEEVENESGAAQINTDELENSVSNLKDISIYVDKAANFDYIRGIPFAEPNDTEVPLKYAPHLIGGGDLTYWASFLTNKTYVDSILANPMVTFTDTMLRELLESAINNDNGRMIKQQMYDIGPSYKRTSAGTGEIADSSYFACKARLIFGNNETEKRFHAVRTELDTNKYEIVIESDIEIANALVTDTKNTVEKQLDIFSTKGIEERSEELATASENDVEFGRTAVSTTEENVPPSDAKSAIELKETAEREGIPEPEPDKPTKLSDVISEEATFGFTQDVQNKNIVGTEGVGVVVDKITLNEKEYDKTQLEDIAPYDVLIDRAEKSAAEILPAVIAEAGNEVAKIVDSIKLTDEQLDETVRQRGVEQEGLIKGTLAKFALATGIGDDIVRDTAREKFEDRRYELSTKLETTSDYEGTIITTIKDKLDDPNVLIDFEEGNYIINASVAVKPVSGEDYLEVQDVKIKFNPSTQKYVVLLEDAKGTAVIGNKKFEEMEIEQGKIQIDFKLQK
jgi:hypothetical protein